MLEQLSRQIAGSSFPSSGSKGKAASLVTTATDRLKALGVNVAVLDSGSAANIPQALGIARAGINAQSFPNAESKWLALGEIDRLATEVIAALNS